MRDMENVVAPVLLKVPVDAAYTDWTSNLLDLKGYEGALMVVAIGDLTGVDGSNYLTLTCEECDTTVGTSFTTVAAADLEGAFTVIDATSEDQIIQWVGYRGSKRYIRIKGDYTGTGISAGIAAVVGIAGFPRNAPCAALAAVSAT